jgi:hypothetical protein
MNKNNFYLINSQKNIIQKNIKQKENNNEKIKYITNPNKLISTSTNSSSYVGNPVDIESYLRNSETSIKNKTSIQLNSDLSPNNFSVLYSNKLRKNNRNKNNKNNKNNNFTLTEPYKGPGRGGGNITISDDIRFGVDTRRYNEEYRNINESTITDRFQIIDSDIQDPKNVVLPFPRGGVQTRDNKKLVNNSSEKDDRFKFQY